MLGLRRGADVHRLSVVECIGRKRIRRHGAQQGAIDERWPLEIAWGLLEGTVPSVERGINMRSCQQMTASLLCMFEDKNGPKLHAKGFGSRAMFSSQ